MALTGTCATCRLRALIQHRALLRHGRQPISTSAVRRQPEQEAGYVDSLYAEFDRSLNQPRGHRRQHGAGGQRAGGRLVVGRYSGQAIPRDHEDYPAPPAWPHPDTRARRAESRHSASDHGAQELLEELAGPRPRRARSTHDHASHQESAVVLPNPDSKAVEPERGSPDKKRGLSWLSEPASKGLPRATVAAIERFMNEQNDRLKWPPLRTALAQVDDEAVLQRLGTDRYFLRTLFHWTLRTTDAFVAPSAPPGPPEIAEQLPSPSMLLAIRTRMTQEPSTVWPAVLWTLAHHAATLRAAGDAESLARARSVVHELMTVWSLCMMAQQQRGRGMSPSDHTDALLQSPSIDFSFLPEASIFQQGVQEHGSRYTLAEVLDFLVPPLTWDNKQRDFDFCSAALVTLDLLRNSEERAHPDFERWTALMEAVVRSVTVKRVPSALGKAAAESEIDQQKAYFAGVVDRFDLRGPVTQRAKVEEAPVSGVSSNSRHPLLQLTSRPPALVESSSDFDRFAREAMTNLGRALEQNKLVYAQRTWENVKQNIARYQLLQLPLWLYEMLLVTFIGLRDQSTVVELWQKMVSDGHQPSVKTYSIVMQGCRYINNGSLLEGFWANMRKAGLQPDGHAWSTRIFSLLKSRQVDAGMRALSEMSQEWLAAARQAHQRDLPGQVKGKRKAAAQVTSADLASRYKTDLDGVPRPDANIMNSVVSGLAAVKDEEIPKVLSWARSFGIEPDLTTYNALLNVAMRRDEPSEALDILRRMESRGVQADGTTWTVLLTALFEGGFLDDLSPTDQQDRIMTFLTSLETANAATIDAKGYALVIDRLLKRYANAPAADAVLRHMTDIRNLQPTPHIYTILMSSHFSHRSGQPDLPAVEALWNSMRTANAGHGVPLDAQFYDRMIEGYATHHVAAGGTKMMQMFLHRTWNEGKKPSWKALTAALRAYAERGEWQRAKGLVERVRRDVENSRAVTQRFGQRDFWGQCVGMGLIGVADVPKVVGRDESQERGRR